MKENNDNDINEINVYNYNNTDILHVKKKQESKKRTNRMKLTKNNATKLDAKKDNVITNDTPLETENRLEIKDITTTNIDEFAENNKTLRNIMENALFSQLSEIKVYLLDFEKDISNRLYNSKEKILPKIDFVELTLLNQGTNISKFKKFGFGLYVFFLYLISLLVTFGVLLIFAFYYIYCIFYKYYQDLEIDCSLFFECNILSLASGVQIKKCRKYYIETFGKKAFLDKYKNFDVIYKEYFFTGIIVFIIAFIINFCYIIYLQKVYKLYKKDNPEINSYSLILSGKNLPFIDTENDIGYDKEAIKSKKIDIKKEIQNLLKIKNVDINFTLKLSDYHEKIEEIIEKGNKKIELQHIIKKGSCLCCCCNKNRLIAKEKIIDDEIIEIKNELVRIRDEEKYNPLYILTFQNKDDYNTIYSRYPHSYFKQIFNNICKKNNKNIYVNKAPNPEDIAFENLEFDKEHRYFKNKIINFLYSCIYVLISFILQLFFEYISDQEENRVFQFIINIIVSKIQDKLNDKFSDFIHNKLSKNLNFWSYSDIKFYSILYKSIFKFINQGIFPLATYFIMDRLLKKEDDDFSSLVNKMFVIIEMDGFGYPMLDLFNVLNKKGKDMYEAQLTMMSAENIDKEFQEQINNKKAQTRYELEQSFKKIEMDLSDNYSEILNIYWITMFYLPIYPIGIIQSFLNLLFKFIIEKNFLINIYQRPEYINPHFGFLCFNFFNFGFALFLCGNIIFFRNEDNKTSFGVIYIIITILIAILPFFLLAKLFVYCCSEKEKEKDLKDIKKKLRSDYGIFIPCCQKEEIRNLFLEFKNNKTLEEYQYDEIEKKINRLNSFDLYKLSNYLRIPKIFSFEIRKIESNFIYQNDSISVLDEEKFKLYNLLMQLGFISYLEEGNVIKPKKRKFDFFQNIDIRALSLKNLDIQENLSNSDSGYFTTFNEKEELIMAYVDNERTIKIFDVFHKQVLNDVKGKHTKKIVCIDYFKSFSSNGDIINYLISISLDNTMIITNLSINEKDKSIIIPDIGDKEIYNIYKDKKNAINTFCLSSCRHQSIVWIITSYYYDKAFKIFYNFGKLLLIVSNNDEFIISLEALYLTEENTYICVRSTPNGVNQRINLFINEHFIRQIYDVSDSYINFKIIKPYNLIEEKKYILVSRIRKNLTMYSLDVIDISPILPLYTKIFNFVVQYYNETIMEWFKKIKIEPATWDSSDAHIPMNPSLKQKIINNNPLYLKNFNFQLYSNENTREKMIKFYESNNEDKFNLGNILLWEDEYIIIGTPFDYMDIIDYKTNMKVGTYNLSDFTKNININENKSENLDDIVIYNISRRINDPEYGSSFIMRDNKGKIQYIRPSRIKDKLNYRIKQSDEYFNDLDDEEKLKRIYFSTRFYFFYLIMSYFAPLISGLIGHYDKETKPKKDTFTAAIVLYVIYAFFGIWFKGCVYDIEDSSHTKRTCTKNVMALCLILKIVANTIIAYWFCLKNKRGIIFILMLFLIYFIHLNFNFILYCKKKKHLLRTYYLGFLFYQISRFCILLFFVISVFAEVNHIETYIYATILCVISAYMYMAYYFNTLLKDITYNNLGQAIFNYPIEWMNLFCCWCRKPKDVIRDIDYRCCTCDSYFLAAAECLKTILLTIIYIFIYFIFITISFIGSMVGDNNEH